MRNISVLTLLQRIEGATHLFSKVCNPWGKLLVQCSIEDLQSWQNPENFTTSQKRLECGLFIFVHHEVKVTCSLFDVFCQPVTIPVYILADRQC